MAVVVVSYINIEYQYLIQMDKTVAKAFGLIETLSLSEAGRGVTDLAAELGLTKANVHRLLKTLVALGYVRKEEGSSRYEPSLKLWELATRVVHRHDLMAVAPPIVRALCRDTGESVQLAVRDGSSIVYVDKADSAHPVRATTQVGSRVPIHCVSTGKAILASSEGPSSGLKFPLTAYTPQTITSREQLEHELTQVRRQGYAVNRGEWRSDIWGVAAAIVNARGETAGAIGVWGPEERFRGAKLKKIGAAVVAAAGKISKEMGNLVQPPPGRKGPNRGRAK